jgi:UDP-N-acetylglucosamine 2-epimerase (non-hydrolysing)
VVARPLVIHVVGARPNYMKIAPIYAEMARRGTVDQRLVHTGQHYDGALSEVFFDELPLPEPHAMLEVRSGTHGEQTARALAALERYFIELRPSFVVVPGDINSTLAAALAAVKLQIPVCHVESGLRSFDWTMPEEHNRRLTDAVSSLLLTHCVDANDNLANEGIAGEHVVMVGNTMIDTLLANVAAATELAAWRQLGLRRGGYLLVTLHRPALVDDAERLTNTIMALERVAAQIPVVFPIHPRTRRRLDNLRLRTTRILMTDPLAYRRFLSFEAGAGAVLTDSGGVQEETTALGVPCFTLRDNTERPVTIAHGSNVLLGLDPGRIDEIPDRLAGPRDFSVPPLWDGCAGPRAAAEIERLALERYADGTALPFADAELPVAFSRAQ